MTFLDGARGGRTLTLLPTTDFKSVASADSAIAPAIIIIFYLKLKNVCCLDALDYVRYWFRRSCNAKGRYKTSTVIIPMASM